MDLQELLKKYLEEEKIATFLEEMKANKIYTASQENMDVRYKKLQDDFTAKDSEHQKTLQLVDELKKSSAGAEEFQAKIKQYEEDMAQLQEENENLKIENAVKVELLGAKAKAKDIDYLMFQMKKDSDKKLTLDDEGKLKDFNSILEGLKTSYPDNFEKTSKKEVEELLLPKTDDDKPAITKEQFDKMGYSSRVKLKEENPEMYNTLTKK